MDLNTEFICKYFQAHPYKMLKQKHKYFHLSPMLGLYMHMHTQKNKHTHTHIFICIYTFIHTYICMYIYTCTHTFVCIDTFTHIHIYLYVHKHSHMYTHIYARYYTLHACMYSVACWWFQRYSLMGNSQYMRKLFYKALDSFIKLYCSKTLSMWTTELKGLVKVTSENLVQHWHFLYHWIF